MRAGELDALPWEDVSSTNVARLAYVPGAAADAGSTPGGLLYVHFYADGEQSIYCYFDVPEVTYVALRQARSVGGMHRKIIRDKYRYERVHVEPDDDQLLEPGEEDPIVTALTVLAERIQALEAEVANLVRLTLGARRPRPAPTRPVTTGPTATAGPRRRK